VVGLVVGAVLAFGPDPKSTGSTPPTDVQTDTAESADPTESADSTESVPTQTERNGWEDTDLSDLERAAVGGLSKGDCYNTLPDLTDALKVPITVDTVECAGPHLSQVVGFVNIADIDSSTSGNDRRTRYRARCENLMDAEGVSKGAQFFLTVLFPPKESLDAGVGVAVCAVTMESMVWTGSLLDGTATGF